VAHLTPLQHALYLVLCEYSEDMYSAAWLHDLEYVVWRGIQRQWVCGGTDIDLLALAALSEVIGGWITYGDDGPLFVPMAEWLIMYDKSVL